MRTLCVRPQAAACRAASLANGRDARAGLVAGEAGARAQPVGGPTSDGSHSDGSMSGGGISNGHGQWQHADATAGCLQGRQRCDEAREARDGRRQLAGSVRHTATAASEPFLRSRGRFCGSTLKAFLHCCVCRCCCSGCVGGTSFAPGGSRPPPLSKPWTAPTANRLLLPPPALSTFVEAPRGRCGTSKTACHHYHYYHYSRRVEFAEEHNRHYYACVMQRRWRVLLARANWKELLANGRDEIRRVEADGIRSAAPCSRERPPGPFGTQLQRSASLSLWPRV